MLRVCAKNMHYKKAYAKVLQLAVKNIYCTTILLLLMYLLSVF